MSIGGLYQNCVFTGDTDNLCDDLALKNKKTGDFNCGEGYKSKARKNLERQYPSFPCCLR